MFAATTTYTGSFNWYDVVVVVALAYGIWSGVRTGLTGELVRGIGWVLTAVVALHFYQPVGSWLSEAMAISMEVGKLTAFIFLTLGMYLLQLGVRALVHKRVKRFKFGAVMENIGGGTAGAVRMAMVMMCLSVVLCLMRSPFWHQQVGKNSQFGSFVVSRFPAVAAMLEKKFPERLWLTEDIRRRQEIDVSDEKLKK